MKGLFLWGTVMVLIGIGICYFAARYMGFSLESLKTSDFTEKTYDVDESFDGISASTSIESVNFVLSEDGRCRVRCMENERLGHEITVTNGTLIIKSFDKKKDVLSFDLYTHSPEMFIELPEKEYRQLTAKTDTGDIVVSLGPVGSLDISGDTANVSVFTPVKGNVRISLTTGDVYLRAMTAGSIDVTTTTGKIGIVNVRTAGGITANVDTGETLLEKVGCGSLVSDGDTGDIVLDGVTASGSFSIIRSTGDVKFIGSDAASISVRTSTGDVTGTLLTGKVFLAKSDTGKVDVPKTAAGGRCEITTDTGRIRIEIAKQP